MTDREQTLRRILMVSSAIVYFMFMVIWAFVFAGLYPSMDERQRSVRAFAAALVAASLVAGLFSIEKQLERQAVAAERMATSVEAQTKLYQELDNAVKQLMATPPLPVPLPSIQEPSAKK